MFKLFHSIMFVFLALACQSSMAVDGASKYMKKPDAWFATDEALKIATNILSYQSSLGGWPKNIDTTAKPYTGDPKGLSPTFDNGATTDELRFLARLYQAGKDEKYRKAVEKGIDYILVAQYPTGGWPQFYPPSKQYHRHITFNDNSMVRIMEFLREMYRSPLFSFVDETRKKKGREAFDRGIQCILKCQIKVNGQLNAWCAQHDELDYSPRPARAYELVSQSGSETVGILKLLMSLENPSPEVIKSVDAAVVWLNAVQIRGIKVVTVDDPKAPKGKDRRVVEDSNAPSLWARFYEIGTNKPMFVDRDGITKYKLSEIGYERRNGYSWLGTWPQILIDTDYPAWKRKFGK